MPTLSPLQCGKYAKAAGFTGQALVTAIAIAGAESSYKTDAVSDVSLETATWGPSVGLWQVRSLKAEYGTGQSRDQSRLTDPAFNAQAAYTISSHGTNFTPWTTYTTGAYLRYMSAAKAAASQLETSGTPSGSNPVTAVVNNVQKHPIYYILGLGLLGTAGWYAYRRYKR